MTLPLPWELLRWHLEHCVQFGASQYKTDMVILEWLQSKPPTWSGYTEQSLFSYTIRPSCHLKLPDWWMQRRQSQTLSETHGNRMSQCTQIGTREILIRYQEKHSPVILVKYWNKLPRDMVGSPSLEVGPSLSEREVEVDDLQEPLQPRLFYDFKSYSKFLLKKRKAVFNTSA